MNPGLGWSKFPGSCWLRHVYREDEWTHGGDAIKGRHYEDYFIDNALPDIDE